MFPKAGVCRSKTIALQYARPRCGDHEELLDGGGHVAGGTKVEEADVPALAATLLPRPVLPGVRFVAGSLNITIINSSPLTMMISMIIFAIITYLMLRDQQLMQSGIVCSAASYELAEQVVAGCSRQLRLAHRVQLLLIRVLVAFLDILLFDMQQIMEYCLEPVSWEA